MKKTHDKLNTFLIYAGLALATIIAFEPVRHNDFTSYDDDIYVTKNPHVTAGLTRESVIWAFTTPHAANWNPVTQLSHMLDCELFGLNPVLHHMTSLLFHVANTLLLFWVLKTMTGAVWPSVFVAAAFALHPLRVESVAWVAERKDVLSGFFWMLTMAAYLRYVKRPGIGRYLLMVLALCLGLMAKPMLITLPCVLLLLDWWPLGRFHLTQRSGRQALPQSSLSISGHRISAFRLVVEKIPLFVIVAVATVVIFIVQQRAGALKPAEIWPLNVRLTNALVSYISYVGKMIYPGRLAVLYPHPGNTLPLWQPIVSFVVLAVISAGTIHTARRRPYLAVGWLWYLGTLVPVIGLIQTGFHAMADRFTYLPSIGFFIMVAWGAAELLAKSRYLSIGLKISASVVLAVLLICTRMQIRHWQNDLTLFGHAIKVTENNYIMHYNLASQLRLRGKLDEAISHYRKALQAGPYKPSYAQLHNSLGLALTMTGRLDDAVEHFNEALRAKPDWPDVHTILALVYEQLGKDDLAIIHWTKTLELRPDSAGALNNLAGILAAAEDTKFQNPTDAVKFAERACELTEYSRPDFLDTLAAAYASAGRFSEAVAVAEKALEIALASEQKKLAEEIQNRLQLYQAGRPYRRK